MLLFFLSFRGNQRRIGKIKVSSWWMESHNKAAKVISRVLSLPACSGTVKFMTHLQVFLLLLPVFRRVKGIKTVYVRVRVWVFMCMSLVFLFVALCLACSQQCLAFSLMDFFMKLCLMPVCVCVWMCGVLMNGLRSIMGFGMKCSMNATSPLPHPFFLTPAHFYFPLTFLSLIIFPFAHNPSLLFHSLLSKLDLPVTQNSSEF